MHSRLVQPPWAMCVYVYLQVDSQAECVRMKPFPSDVQTEGMSSLSTAARVFVPAMKQQQQQAALCSCTDEPKEAPSKKVPTVCPLQQIHTNASVPWWLGREPCVSLNSLTHSPLSHPLTHSFTETYHYSYMYECVRSSCRYPSLLAGHHDQILCNILPKYLSSVALAHQWKLCKSPHQPPLSACAMCAHVYLQAEAQAEGMSNLSTAAPEFVPAVQQQRQAALSADEPNEALPSKKVTAMFPSL